MRRRVGRHHRPFQIPSCFECYLARRLLFTSLVRAPGIVKLHSSYLLGAGFFAEFGPPSGSESRV